MLIVTLLLAPAGSTLRVSRPRPAGSGLPSICHRFRGPSGCRRHSRFVKRLGYDNYEEVRRHAREEKQTGSRLFLTTSTDTAGVQSLGAHIAQGIANIEGTFATITYSQIDAAVEAMLASRKIWVLGFRSSHPFADYFQWQITQVVENIVAIPGGGADAGRTSRQRRQGRRCSGIRVAPPHRAHGNGAVGDREKRRETALHHRRRGAPPPGCGLAFPLPDTRPGPAVQPRLGDGDLPPARHPRHRTVGRCGRTRLRGIETIGDALEEL
ncbi:MurR/RpiR family transcriptional regulator [Aminobacter sp. MDW-2]|nr:MurR/RpiR family transcriptional regulator [Aminobacter sp. MDW-2]